MGSSHTRFGSVPLRASSKKSSRYLNSGSSSASAGDSDGPPRRYYTLSGFGRRVARAEGERMERLVMRVREAALNE